MLRRSLFNMLLGNAEAPTVTRESVTQIDMPAYLKTENVLPLVQDFDEIIPGQGFELKVSTKHAFSMSWSAAGATSGSTSLQLGKKSDSANTLSPIELGLHHDGYLYIGGINDKRVLSPEKRSHQLQLLLEVHPQAGNLTFAKLTLKDLNGLTLATVKNSSFLTEDWAGNLINVGQYLEHLKIAGSTLK
jgi:hypothetical protein